MISIILIYAGVPAVMTFERTKVWKNDGTLWSDVIAKYPDDNRIMLPITNRANNFYMEKRMPEALQDYLHDSSINPGDDVVLEKIGRIYGKDMNNIDSALFYFRKAYEKNNKNFNVLTDLGIVFGMRRDLRNSLEYSLQALKINGNDPSLLYNIGITYQHLGEPEKTKEFFEKEAKINKSVNDSTGNQ